MFGTEFTTYDWVNLAVLLVGFAAGAFSIRHLLLLAARQKGGLVRVPEAVIVQFAFQNAAMAIWGALTIGNRAVLSLCFLDIVIVSVSCLVWALAVVMHLNRYQTRAVWRTGLLATSGVVFNGCLLHALAYPQDLLVVKPLFGVALGAASIVASAWGLHLAVKHKANFPLRAMCFALVSVVFVTASMTGSIMFSVNADRIAFALPDTTGMNAERLQNLLVMVVLASFSLAFVVGRNPRRHWRRYAVTVGLVATFAVYIYYSTATTFKQVTQYFELSQSFERIQKLQSDFSLELKAHAARKWANTSRVALPDTVFKDLNELAVTTELLESTIRNAGPRSSVYKLYFTDSHEAGRPLGVSIRAYGEYVKELLGLNHSQEVADAFQEGRFESDLSILETTVLSLAADANNSQRNVLDISFTGGLFLVIFMGLGVFYPAHTSTLDALQQLEGEKNRVEKLAICAEHTTKGIVLTDERGRLTWCNDAFLDICGFRLSEMLGRTLMERLHHDESDQAVLRKMFEDLGAGRTAEFEVVAKRKDQREFWMRAAITPIIRKGKLHQFVHVIEDITEDRALSERLQKAHQETDRLALIARHATDGMAILDRDYQMAWINPAMTRMTGYSVEELRKSPLHECLNGPLADMQVVGKILTGLAKRQIVSVESIAYPKSGPYYWIEALHTPIFEDDGRFAGYVIVHRDITERKNLEFELIANRDELAARVEERTQTIRNQSLELEKALDKERELNAMQTEFVSMASHEFRTPLTIIDGVARRIAKNAAKFSPDDIVERALSIRSAVKRMTMLVERTLDASRLSSGRIRLTPEEFDLPKLVSDVVARQRDVAPTHEIDVDISDLPPVLFGDARLMDNVFTNIVSNAVKYSGDSRRVEVRGYEDDGYAVISVKDFGIGIPKDELSKIFQRFFRASTASGIPGTGIGLNLVKSLIEMHFGLVTLESEEGAWTRMTVCLPLESPLRDMPSEATENMEHDDVGDVRRA